MNCQKGDLAIVVESWAGNQGKIVRCVRIDPVRSEHGQYAPGGHIFPPEPVWIIEPELVDFDGDFSDYIADSQLRPIRDPGDDATDEMVLIAGKPHEVTA